MSRDRVRRSSGSIDREDALTREEAERAVALGVRIADEEVDAGADLLVPGDMGIGNTTPAAVLIGLLAGVAPWIAAVEQQRVAIALSPPMRALANLSEGRLYGGLFADLQVLKAAIGGDPAVAELVADVHRTLGQWEEARTI